MSIECCTLPNWCTQKCLNDFKMQLQLRLHMNYAGSFYYANKIKFCVESTNGLFTIKRHVLEVAKSMVFSAQCSVFI